MSNGTVLPGTQSHPVSLLYHGCSLLVGLEDSRGTVDWSRHRGDTPQLAVILESAYSILKVYCSSLRTCLAWTLQQCSDGPPFNRIPSPSAQLVLWTLMGSPIDLQPGFSPPLSPYLPLVADSTSVGKTTIPKVVDHFSKASLHCPLKGPLCSWDWQPPRAPQGCSFEPEHPIHLSGHESVLQCSRGYGDPLLWLPPQSNGEAERANQSLVEVCLGPTSCLLMFVLAPGGIGSQFTCVSAVWPRTPAPLYHPG